MPENQETLEDDPSTRELRQHLETTRFYFAGGQWERGAESARRALALDPNCADAHALLALCAANLGNPIEALREAEAALALDSSEPYYFYASAVAALAAERPARAEEEVRRGLELDPECAYLHLQMFEIYSSQKRMAEAKAFIRYATYLSPLRADYHLKLAVAHLMTEEPEKGDREIRETLRLDPENAVALKLLGVRQIGKKDVDAGVDTLRYLLTLDPDDTYIQREMILAKKPYLRITADPKDGAKTNPLWQTSGVISLLCALRAIFSLPMRSSESSYKAQQMYFIFCLLCLATFVLYVLEEMLVRQLPHKNPMLGKRFAMALIVAAQAFLSWFYWTVSV